MSTVTLSGDTPAAASSDSWLDAWRHAVRTASGVAVLLSVQDATFLDVSSDGANLFNTSPDRLIGGSYFELADRSAEAHATFDLARQRLLDGLTARRLFTRPDGEAVEIASSAHVIRASDQPDLALWVVADDAAATVDVIPLRQPVPLVPAVEAAQLEIVTVGGRFEISTARVGTGSVAGRHRDDLVGCPLVDLFDPADVRTVLLLLARATTEPSAAGVARLQATDGRRELALVTVSATTENGQPGYEVRLTPTSAPSFGDRLLASGRVGELSPRRREVLERLVRGERVPTIASEMFLSRSTVRNHLSAIFRQFGVHSQEQLLNIFRADVSPDE